MKEVWRPIAGYEGLYEVSDLGNVRRLDRVQVVVRYGKRTECIRRGGSVAAHPNARGYLRVTLFDQGKGRDFFVQRLVCAAFHGPAPSEAHQAAHLDGNNQNNRSDNLSWKLPKANAADALRHGTYTRGSKAPRAKLNETKVLQMRALYASGEHTFQDIADQFGISHRGAFAAVRGITWAHVGE